MALPMTDEAKRSMRRPTGIARRAMLATVGILGAMIGFTGPSLLPSPVQRNVGISTMTMAVLKASDHDTGTGVVAEGYDERSTADQIQEDAPSQQAATYRDAPGSAERDSLSPPSIAVDPQMPLASRLVPLPVPRPPEFRSGRAQSPTQRVVARRAPPVAAAVPEDTRSFMEKLFGVERPQPPQLAYAALESKPIDDVFRRGLNVVPKTAVGGIAIYDIRAKAVTLPNGETLEAHSGLGESMDDPGHVHVRMKGPTPVGVYDITEREQPFHGVRALRLHPIGGPEAVHGRVGLLAHTYMLGASGASNGCVSFKNYDKFLQAYLRGEVKRLVVIAGG